MHDDELLDALGSALLDDAAAEPPADRIAQIRAAADARRLAASAAPDAAHATVTPIGDREDQVGTRPDGPSRFGLRLLGAAAAIVAAVAIGAVVARSLDDNGVDGEVEYAGAITGADAVGDLEVVKTGIGRVVSLNTTDLAILPTGEYYEVWFVGPGDSIDAPNRISAGTFHPDANGVSDVTFAGAVDPALYPVVQITSEPGDGNPAPSGTVVLEVQIAS